MRCRTHALSSHRRRFDRGLTTACSGRRFAPQLMLGVSRAVMICDDPGADSGVTSSHGCSCLSGNIGHQLSHCFAVARRDRGGAAAVVAGLRSVEIAPEAEVLAAALLQGAALPAKARADALHIAIAATQGVSYLLTWNSAHSANAEKRPVVEAVCRRAGYEPPILCTPDELMGEESSHVDAP